VFTRDPQGRDQVKRGHNHNKDQLRVIGSQLTGHGLAYRPSYRKNVSYTGFKSLVYPRLIVMNDYKKERL
jgi:hypothetical protein